jgi:predicted porin
MNGFRAQIQTALAEAGSSCTYANYDYNTNYCFGPTDDGKLTSMRLRYNVGPLDAAIANTVISYGTNSLTGSQPSASGSTTTSTYPTAALASGGAYAGKNTINSLAGSYQLTPALKVMAQYNIIQREANIQTVAQKLTHNMIGAAYAMGNTTLKLSFAKASRADGTLRSNGQSGVPGGTGAQLATACTTCVTGGYEDGAKQNMTAVGFVHDLSKRTALYGTYSRSTVTPGPVSGSYNAAVGTGFDQGLRAGFGYSGPATAPGASNSATGIDLGIRHRF